MRCPICKREVVWEGNDYRPFCSERCKLIDLDNWLNGRYRVAGARTAAPGDADEASTDRAEEERE